MNARRSRWPRILLLNLIALAAIFAAFDVYLRMTEEGAESGAARLEFSNPQGFHERDDVLGYRPASGYASNVRFYYDDELIFDVDYTLDEHGLRISPRSGALDGAPCVLFFGGSYVFGAGVDDRETFPYLVGAAVAGRYVVRNFAFGGYGPHQMLAAIESGLVERAARCIPKLAVYLAHSHHLQRAAGKFRSDRHGPRYVLRDRRAVRDGNFDDAGPPTWLLDVVERSEFAGRMLDSRQADQDDIDLFRAIVARSSELLREAHPGIEFHVLYWDAGPPELFGRDFDASEAEIHRISDVLPIRDPAELAARYQIPHDGHPNASAHRVLADYVIDEVTGR